MKSGRITEDAAPAGRQLLPPGSSFRGRQGCSSRFARLCRLCGLALVVLGVGLPAAAQRAAQPGGIEVPADEVPLDEGEDFRGLHLPSDRTASRGLAMAAEEIQEGQYSQAIRFLDRLLSEQEDSFMDVRLGATHYTGLKAEARRLLGSLPGAAREIYLSTYGTTAHKRLEAAVAAGDLAEIERVARQFFHTDAGYEASFLLALYDRDMGRPLSAAIRLVELIATQQAVASLGPELYLHAALAWRDAGEPAEAQTVLQELKQESPGAMLTIAGRPQGLFADEQDPLAWLEDVAGKGAPSLNEAQEHWTTYRGNAARNGSAAGGVPHMRVRWRARVTNLPKLEDLLGSLRRTYQRKGIVALPAMQPIAVGDVVVMRTADRIVGVDFETGSLIWDVRPEPDKDFEDLQAATEQADSTESAPQLAQAFEQRVWDDGVYGTLSSDAERVYGVRGLSLTTIDQEALLRFGAGFRFGAGRMTERDEETPTNILTAVSLSAEGKRVWEINGSDVGGKLAGAFFLGPPLCVDGRLYVLAEVKGSIYLVALRNVETPPRWELEWMQQLANLEVGINLDPLRRLSGAMPSLASGVLVCPTSAGVVVGVDVTRRSLLWAYRYGLREEDLPQVMTFRGVEGTEAPGMRTNERWVDATAVLADGKVLLTPRESDELHCLDLTTGKLLWKRRRGNGLFLAGVHDGVVAIVGTDRVEAIRLADGLRAWEADHVMLPDGAGPSGRGFLSGEKYFLPLNSGEIVAFDMTSGQFVARAAARDGHVLGNLIAHRGAIIAQNELFLEKYDQKEVFRKATEAILKENSTHPVALRNLGELALSDGSIADAVRYLKDSLQSDPDDGQTKEMLAQALIDGLEEDFSLYREELPLARELVSRSEDAARLARVTAVGLQSAGDVLAAFEGYLHLAELDADDPQLQSMSADWEARTSRWINAQLVELWQAAQPQDRERMEQLLRASEPLEQSQAGFTYVAGLLPFRESAMRAAEGLVEAEPGLEAEFKVAAISAWDDSPGPAWTTAMRSQLLHALGRHEDAGVFDAALENGLAEATVRGGVTGRTFVENWREQGVAAKPRRWPSGRVVVQRHNLPAGEEHDKFQSLRIDGPVDPSLEGYRFFLDQTNQIQQALVVVDPYGRSERSIPLATSDGQAIGYQMRDRCHGVLAGHLLVVSSGEKIAAIDLLQQSSVSSDLVLWEADTIEPFEGLAAQLANPYIARRNRAHRKFGAANKEYAIDDAGRPLGWIGPVGPAGVVFHAQGELRCVDPLTGEVNWRRRDVPQGCALFGDDDYVFALPYQAREAIVFRTLDGKRLGTREVPPLDEHYEVLGRKILRWATEEGEAGTKRRLLELVDAWTGEADWSRSLSLEAFVCTVEGEWVGVMDPSGKFDLVDIASGEDVFSHELEPDRELERIYVLRSRERVVLITNRPSRPSVAGAGIHPIHPADYPIVTGRVYLFDRESGRPLLPVPAEVDRQGLALMQPVESPLLGFVSLTNTRSGQGRTNITLLVLDKTTGSALERTDIEDATTARFRIYPDAERPNVMLVDMAKYRLELEFTDEAAAPEPPADSGVESTRQKPRGRGVLGLFSSRAQPAERQEKLAAIAVRP